MGCDRYLADDPARHARLISAVTRELGSVRKLVKKGLEDNDYHAVEQDNFPPDYRDLIDKLAPGSTRVTPWSTSPGTVTEPSPKPARRCPAAKLHSARI